MEPISARSFIDAVSTGDSKRKDQRRQRLSSAALSVADRKVQPADPPIVIAGVLRLIDFVLISLSGSALYLRIGLPQSEIVALSNSGFEYCRRHSGDLASSIYHQVQHFQAGFCACRDC